MGNQLTWWFFAAPSARHGVCQGRLESAATSSGEPTVCTSSQPHLEWHQLGSLKSVKARVFTPQKMANATNECPFSESQLFNIYQHVTGDHVSISEIWVQREQKQPCSYFFVEETALHLAQIGIYCSLKRILCISYSALSFHLLICFLGEKNHYHCQHGH